MSSVPDSIRLSDEDWQRVRTLLPPSEPRKKRGRPRMSDRQALEAICYVFRFGCGWKSLPRELGAASTVHDRFLEWRDKGILYRLWREGFLPYDQTAYIRSGQKAG